MRKLWQSRRSILRGLSVMTLFAGPVAVQNATAAQHGSHAYLLGDGEGDQLAAPGGVISITIDPTRGSDQLDVGTLRVQGGAGIRTHVHAGMDEFFYILAGNGTWVLDDVPHRFAKGATVFIPRGTWHGLENPEGEVSMVWGVSPGGLASFFRELASPPGAPAKALTLAQRNEIAQKYGTTYR
jgi:mannose-6-phosphate isomerase-like protein (cupin superfamily)